MQRPRRPVRRGAPLLEALEGRQLLSALNPVKDRRTVFREPNGAQVVLTLHGPGSIDGSSMRPDGSIDVVFAGTTAASVLTGRGHAVLRTMHDALAAPNDFSGNGSEPLGQVKLNSFDLADGGVVNLSGGASYLSLNSAGANSQIHLREIATSSTTSTSPFLTFVGSPSTGTGGGQVGTPAANAAVAGAATPGAVGTPAGAATVAAGGLGSGVTVGSVPNGAAGGGGGGGGGAGGGGGGAGGGGGGAPSLSPTTINTTGAPGVLGAVTSGGSTGTARTTTPTVPPGPVVAIQHVRGAPRSSSPFGDPQLFAYDPTANALVRFDAATGALLQSIPVAGLGTPIAGVSMARDAGRLVALIGDGSTVRAYDAVTGAAVGRFSTAPLAAAGLTRIDGLGSTNTRTLLTDSSAGANGLAQLIDVTASLATGQAVAIGAPFAPIREFRLTGGVTGVAGSDVLYATGVGHLDSTQPFQFQAGVMAISAFGPLAEITRTKLPSTNPLVATPPNLDPNSPAATAPTQALGSLDGDLALVTSVADGKNVVSLFKPSGLAADGSIKLNDPNRLAGLSESFHPELAGSALLDVRGNLRSFNARDARSFVLNESGTLNLVKIDSAQDTTIIGHPVAHVAIPRRRDVQLLSSARTVGTRDGVTIVPNLRQVGPLALP